MRAVRGVAAVGGAGWVAVGGVFLWIVYGESRGVGRGSWRLKMGMEILKNFIIFITRLVGRVEYPREVAFVSRC